MKFVQIIGYGLIALFMLAACVGETADKPTPDIEGPALVMFYTDN